jgi:hypothetical protein
MLGGNVIDLSYFSHAIFSGLSGQQLLPAQEYRSAAWSFFLTLSIVCNFDNEIHVFS